MNYLMTFFSWFFVVFVVEFAWLLYMLSAASSDPDPSTRGGYCGMYGIGAFLLPVVVTVSWGIIGQVILFWRNGK